MKEEVYRPPRVEYRPPPREPKWNIRNCEMCGKRFRRKIFKHINVAQNPSVFKFCSHKCKLKFVNALKNKNTKDLKNYPNTLRI